MAVAAAAALTLAGCSSSSGGKKSEEGAANASAGKANTPRMTVALVTHQAPGDTFWDIVRKGAEAAAAKDNIKLVYSADPNAGNQANLVQNAIDQKVDGIAVTLAKPDALKGVIGKAEKAGIPVVGLNSGLSDWKKLGLLEFFGQDETVAGEALRQEAQRGRRQERRLCHPGAGQRRPDPALRRREEDLRGQARDPERQRHRHAVREVDDHRQAQAGRRPSTTSSRSAPPSR